MPLLLPSVTPLTCKFHFPGCFLVTLANISGSVRSNMENEGERNYIMQVVCEATQAEEVRVQAGAFGCLNRIMGAYYEKMRFYMEKALFGLSIMGMKSEEEDVAKLAIEFWCTVCEEEIAIEDDNAEVSLFPMPPMRALGIMSWQHSC